MEGRIEEIETLLAKSDELELTEESIKQVKEQLTRMKKELSYRQMFEYNQKLFDEANNVKKGKK